MSGPEQYGQFYWCAKVSEDVAPDGEIYVMADWAEVTESGALLFIRDKNDGQVNLALAPGQWSVFYAASLIDGHAVAVEHWSGEVVR